MSLGALPPGAVPPPSLQNVWNSKLSPLHKYAVQMAVEMVDRIFTEFDRETNLMFDEFSAMRVELQRVAELLESQLARERQLHDLLESLSGHHNAMGNHALNGLMNAKHPNLQQLHDLLEQATGHNEAVVQATMQSVQQAQAHADGHVSHAQHLKGQSITTEHELARIKQLLAMPPPNLPPMNLSQFKAPAPVVSSPVVAVPLSVRPPMTAPVVAPTMPLTTMPPSGSVSPPMGVGGYASPPATYPAAYVRSASPGHYSY
eukprot:TRINITY_DN13022_c0_g1_i1.p1 TRINITY_DN13022_c0_g1~~TRINITY_DN13022_c0_g1_i1.p1  ORF type:complete len:260 (-),score=42.43 TRINITY_DN13022_c0_g1_i1:131-910(-)